jgi:hypothetical protein
MRRKDMAPGAKAGNRPRDPGQDQAPLAADQEKKGQAYSGEARDKGQGRVRQGWVLGQHKPVGRDRDKGAGQKTAKSGFKRRDGGKPREERPRFHAQASPSAAKASFDPDSPFAALSSLKAALEKRSQE